MNRFLLALLFLLLALVGPVHAQERLDAKYRRGELLGNGQYKAVYTVEGRPDIVIGIIGWDGLDAALTDEKAALDVLAKHGVPAARVLEIGTYGGKPAYVLERYATGTRAPDFGEAQWKLLNERSVADLLEIEKKLVEAKLDVTDLQFLIGSDGRVVIADPLAVKEGQPTSESTRSSIQGLVKAARTAIEARALATKIARMPGSEDPRLARWFATRIVEAEERDAKGTATLVDALLLYLESGETTEGARRVARAVREGKIKVDFFPKWEGLAPGAFLVHLGRSFPRVAADLVLEGTRKLNDGIDAIERDLVARASELEFLRTKRAPSELEHAVVAGERTGGSSTEMGRSPSALVSALERARGGNVDPAERARLEERARLILDRGKRTNAEANTSGIGRSLEELTRDRLRSRDKERVR